MGVVLTFSLSERLMAVLSPVVQPTPGRGLEAAEDAGSAHTVKATGTRISRKPFFV